MPQEGQSGGEESTVGAPLSNATPAAVGSAAAGSSSSASRADHVHAHGNQAGGGLHPDAVAAGASGFMSGADKTKVDGVAASAAAVGSTTPANVGTAAAGSAATAARSDHVHNLPDVVTAGSKGGSAKLLRSAQYDAKGRLIADVTDVDLGALGTGLLKSTTGTGALSIATPNTDFMAALAGSGIAKVVAGVPALASAGVDYSKGPWKLFSTVRNGAPAQTLSIPVTDGDNNGIVRASGVLVSDGTDRALTVKVNGSATNVQMQEVYGNSTVPASDRTSVGVTGPYGAMFDLVFITAKTAGALRRFGIMRVAAYSASLIQQVYLAGIGFKDTTTTITSIDIDCGNATGLAANTFGMVEEGIIG